MQAFPRCAALLRDGRACERTVVAGSESCVHHERLLAQHGADALKQGLPRRKQARGRWQPTIRAVSADEIAVSCEGSASSARRSANPSTVRLRLAEAAAENVDDISPHAARGRDVSVEAGLGRVRAHRLWQPQASEVPIPDVRARVCRDRAAATRRTRPPRAGRRTTIPATPAPHRG
jgi:hypothetical protein